MMDSESSAIICSMMAILWSCISRADVMMKYIDLEQWPRKKHFTFFNGLDFPHFQLTAPVEITALSAFLAEHHLPFFKSMVYLSTRAANGIPEFRQRIREDQVVEHERVHPSVTVMADDEVFSFCAMTYTEDFSQFLENADAAIARVQNNPMLDDLPGRDDLLFMTSIPWVSFTGLMHPLHMRPVDCIPRIAWGKFFEEHGAKKLPLSVQVHHALVDGLHVGRFFEAFQHFAEHPNLLFS